MNTSSFTSLVREKMPTVSSGSDILGAAGLAECGDSQNSSGFWKLVSGRRISAAQSTKGLLCHVARPYIAINSDGIY